MSDARVTSEPHDRLTRLCGVMTAALDADPESGDARCVVFLESASDERGGFVIHGYEDPGEAVDDLFWHLRAMFRANGRTLIVVSPEGTAPPGLS